MANLERKKLLGMLTYWRVCSASSSFFRPTLSHNCASCPIKNTAPNSHKVYIFFSGVRQKKMVTILRNCLQKTLFLLFFCSRNSRLRKQCGNTKSCSLPNQAGFVSSSFPAYPFYPLLFCCYCCWQVRYKMLLTKKLISLYASM